MLVGVLIPVPPFAEVSAVPRFSVPNDAAAAKRLVLEAVVEKKFVDVALANVVLPVKEFTPLNVLLFARSVEDAAEMVILLPLVKGVPLMVPRVPVKRLVPIDDVATSLPVLSVLRSALVREVNHVVPE